MEVKSDYKDLRPPKSLIKFISFDKLKDGFFQDMY